MSLIFLRRHLSSLPLAQYRDPRINLEDLKDIVFDNFIDSKLYFTREQNGEYKLY